jgi:hypothetical protein
MHGRYQEYGPSRFLKEIPEYLKDEFPPSLERFATPTTPAGVDHQVANTKAPGFINTGMPQEFASTDEVFKVGDKVLHRAWGRGVIVGVKNDKEITYQIAFPENGIRTLLASLAPLKRL